MPYKLLVIWNIIKSGFRPKLRTKADLHIHQQRLISKHLNWLKEKSPWFKKLTYTKLSELPITNKAFMMEHFDELNTVGIKKKEALKVAIEAEQTRNFTPQIKGITIGLSSGTSGNKGLFLVSLKDKVKYVEVIYQKVLRPIKFRKTRVALFFRANSNLYESVGSLLLKFKFFDLTQTLESQFVELEKLNPHILVAPPGMLSILADQKLKGLSLNPEKIISVAEILEDDTKAKLEHVFKVTVHQLYQCTEGFLGSTCKHGNLHLHEDYIYFEKKWIDIDKKRFYPIITDFTRTSQPIIRYELNDILVEGEPCSCGNVCTTIKKIEGRSDDIFNLVNENGKEIIVFPDELRNTVIITSDDFDNYQIRQTGAREIRISLSINANSSLEQTTSLVEKALQKLFERKGIEPVSINFTEWRPINLSKKQRRIFNQYNK